MLVTSFRQSDLRQVDALAQEPSPFQFSKVPPGYASSQLLVHPSVALLLMLPRKA